MHKITDFLFLRWTVNKILKNQHQLEFLRPSHLTLTVVKKTARRYLYLTIDKSFCRFHFDFSRRPNLTRWYGYNVKMFDQ